MKSVLHSPSLLSSAINYLEEWPAVASLCCPSPKLWPSEVNTGGGSDRVAVLPGSPVGWIEGPVATAPGSDLIAANLVSGLSGAVFGNQAVLEISHGCGIVTFGASDRAGELSGVSIEGYRLAKPAHHRAETADKCAETADKCAETADKCAETADKCAETTGKYADTAGKCAETTDKCAETADKCAETAGKRAETADKYAKSVGEWADSAGSGAGAIGTSPHPPAKWGTTAIIARTRSLFFGFGRDESRHRKAA